MKNQNHSMENETSNDEIDLIEIIRKIWSFKLLILSIAVFFVVLSGTYVNINRVLTKSDIYQYIIHTDFDGRENDTYPNGIPFRLSDIISPVIIAHIYNKENIIDYDIGIEEFSSRFSVSPYAEFRSVITKKYQLLFDQKKSTVAELQEMQRQQSQELQLASKTAAIIRFDASGMSISEAAAEEVLKSVPTTWTRIAIDSRGVLKPDIPLVQATNFDESVIQGLSTVDAFELIIQRIDLLSAQLAQVSSLPGGNGVYDSETNFNVETLRNRIRDLKIRLNTIPQTWSKSIAIDPQNRPLPINLYSPKLFDPEILAGTDYLVALDLLEERIGLIQSNITTILNQEFGGVVVDFKTGLSVYDIRKLLDDINEFELRQLRSPILQLGLSKDPQLIEFYYNSRITELERKKENLKGKSNNLSESLKGYASTGGSVPQPLSGNALTGGSTVIPQFGDAFIDRLVKLSEEGGDKKFRQEYSRKSVDFLQSVEDIKSDINQYKEYLKIFTERSAVEGLNNLNNKEKYISILEKRIPVVLNKLKNYSEVTIRLSRRLRFSNDMFTLASGPNSPVKIARDYYLGSNNNNNTGRSLEMFLPKMKEYAGIASRLYDKVGVDQYGADQLLFRPVSNAELVREKFVRRTDIFIFAGAGFLGLFFGLVVTFIYSSIKEHPTSGVTVS